MVHLVGLSRQTPWSPRGEGWPNCIKKCQWKSQKSPKKRDRNLHQSSNAGKNTAEQPELDILEGVCKPPIIHRNYWLCWVLGLLIREFWVCWPHIWPPNDQLITWAGTPGIWSGEGGGAGRGLKLPDRSWGGGRYPPELGNVEMNTWLYKNRIKLELNQNIRIHVHLQNISCIQIKIFRKWILLSSCIKKMDISFVQ